MDKGQIQEALRKAQDLNKLAKSPEYKETLLPVLKQLAEVKATNPSKYETREIFAREVEIAFARASAFEELIKLLDEQDRIVEDLTKKLKAPEKNWSGGN